MWLRARYAKIPVTFSGCKKSLTTGNAGKKSCHLATKAQRNKALQLSGGFRTVPAL